MSLIEKIGMALCQNALGGKHCPCAETGQFKCAETYPGYQAQAVLTAISEYAGDGVQDVDRGAAKSLLGRDDAGPSWWSIDSGNADNDRLVQAFAQHRALAIAAERARIVAKLRDLAHESQRKAAAPIADAIERWEV